MVQVLGLTCAVQPFTIMHPIVLGISSNAKVTSFIVLLYLSIEIILLLTALYCNNTILFYLQSKNLTKAHPLLEKPFVIPEREIQFIDDDVV